MTRTIGQPTKTQLSVIHWLQALLGGDLPVLIYDCESTGFGRTDEVIQIGVINTAGETLLNTLLKPTVKVPADATAIHGLTDDDLVNAPTIADIYKDLKKLFESHHIVAYNHAFDWRLLNQTLNAYDLNPIKPLGSHCFMIKYAEYYGEYNWRNGRRMKGYKWQKLSDACSQVGIEWDRENHDATEDCIMTLRVMQEIVDSYKD